MKRQSKKLSLGVETIRRLTQLSDENIARANAAADDGVTPPEPLVTGSDCITWRKTCTCAP